jgi:hypothetical protein
LIATTQLSVNVVIRIFSGFTPAFKIKFAVLAHKTWVLPVPGPAITIAGHSV